MVKYVTFFGWGGGIFDGLGKVLNFYFSSDEQLLLWQELNKGTVADPVGSIQTFTFSSLESIIMVAYGVSIKNNSLLLFFLLFLTATLWSNSLLPE